VQELNTGKSPVANGANSSPKKGAGLGSQALRPLQGLIWAVKPLMRGALRKTTLLLMFIWFTNALCYYGLVLLTTSVSSAAVVAQMVDYWAMLLRVFHLVHKSTLLLRQGPGDNLGKTFHSSANFLYPDDKIVNQPAADFHGSLVILC